MMDDKVKNGIFYTARNPFNNPAFKKWADAANLPQGEIIEPFAGGNFLITALQSMGLCDRHRSFDIYPSARGVKERDTLADFPTGFEVCVTNPPWLAKNSATVRGLPFPDTQFDDLYKFALDKCLTNCGYVAALVPESFIRAGLFQERLTDFVSLTGQLFKDTGHPVGLALFGPEAGKDVMVWHDGRGVGLLSVLEQARPKSQGNTVDVRFNRPDGNAGLIALDNTIEPSIRFCEVKDLANYKVKSTGRHITKIKVDGEVKIQDWNDCLNSFRSITQDVLLTCYKGIRKDGKYRRRLDWQTARGIINYAL